MRECTQLGDPTLIAEYCGNICLSLDGSITRPVVNQYGWNYLDSHISVLRKPNEKPSLGWEQMNYFWFGISADTQMRAFGSSFSERFSPNNVVLSPWRPCVTATWLGSASVVSVLVWLGSGGGISVFLPGLAGIWLWNLLTNLLKLYNGGTQTAA